MATRPPMPNADQEEARTRISSMAPAMREVARRAIEKGLIDPARFDLVGHSHDTPLESVANPIGLEAIVLLTGRPPMLIKNDRVVIDDLARNAMGAGSDLPDLNPALISGIEGMLPSIGRVEFINNAMQWGGTGWIIEGATDPARRWVVTNRHVAKIVGRRVSDGRGVFTRSPQGALYESRVDFNRELGAPQPGGRVCKVERIVFIADDTEADCALFEITVSAAFAPGALQLAEARAAKDALVGTVGYPAYDSRNEDSPMRRYFADIFDVKRFSPGRITQSEAGKLLMHDCTTLGGNSGSPLINLTDRTVVGLHFSGNYRVANSAVSVETLKQLATGRLFAVTAAGASGGTEAPSDGRHSAAELAGRAGYSPQFLGNGLLVPVPQLTAELEADLATPVDAEPGRPHEIRYTHFGVYYSKRRKSPRFTAVNIDGEHSVRIKRIPPDRWFFDERIPIDLQLGTPYYAGDLDRGHMVRREDPNWGPLANQANYDTFHFTNCALQHALLNRGKTQWQGLENYILESSRTEGFKACVFTGPILADDDPPIGLPGLDPNVLIPREFWKVVVMPKAGGKGLHATAYLLSQGDLIRTILEDRNRAAGLNEAVAEGFNLGAYRTFQVALRHIEQVSGLTWPGLAGADPLEAHTDESISAVTYATIESLEDIVL